MIQLYSTPNRDIYHHERSVFAQEGVDGMITGSISPEELSKLTDEQAQASIEFLQFAINQIQNRKYL